MIYKIFAIVMMVLLSACSSTEEVAKQTKQTQTDYNTCQQNYYTASELVKIELKEDGTVKSMSVGNQNLRPCQMAQAPESAMVASIKVIGSVANSALNVAASSVPYVAMSKIAVDGIKHAGGNTYNEDSFNSEANQANQQTSNTETVSGIKAGNDVDQSQQNQNNPVSNETNTDDNSITDSNNPVDSSNNSTSTENNEAAPAVTTEDPVE